jgi:uroporphyrinogen-III synthase
VTRPSTDAAELAGLLRDAGAIPVLVPLTRIIPPVSDTHLRHAVASLEEYGWVVFTSANAVRAVAGLREWHGTRTGIAAVGLATASAVHDLTGRDADVIPAEFTGSALADALRARGSLADIRVLWPRGDLSRDDLRRTLEDAGATVDDPVAYRTVADASAAASLAAMVEQGTIDVITFTAPSAVDSFAGAWTGSLPCEVAVIGPATAAAARARGFRVHAEPEQHIIPALVAALSKAHAADSA